MQNLSFAQVEIAKSQSEIAKSQQDLATWQNKIAEGISLVYGTMEATEFVRSPMPPGFSFESAANNVVYSEPLKFTEKEISSMPRTFRTEFRVEGCTARIRKRCDGRYNCSWEIRYRRNGYNISVSARTREEAEQKFIKKLKTIGSDAEIGKVPTVFNDFAMYWFANFHKRKVANRTYKTDMQRFNSTLAHRFVKTNIKRINAKDLQEILDEYVNKGHGKTAEEVHSLLNQIFKAAVKFGLIAHNPVDMVFHQKHERKHGVALTLEEEALLLSATAGTRYQTMFAVALYTGLRPNEYKTVRIEGDMIFAKNSKRKNGEIVYKRIPIIKKLRPYLVDVKDIQWVSLKYIREKINKILPEHILYDLRTTFYTHCVTCGVAESARDEMVGHASGALKSAYTDLPDEFLYSEAAKLDW